MKKILYILLFVPLALFAQEPISYQLSSGWNMVGFTACEITPIDEAFQNALENGATISETFEIIKDVRGEFWHSSLGEYSSLTQLTPGEGYMMYVQGSSTTVQFSDIYCDDITYQLNSGWNMVAFTGDVNAENNIVSAMDNALGNGAGIANTFQVIKNVSGQFWSSAFAQINTFNPGQAYMMYVNGAPTTLSFTDNSTQVFENNPGVEFTLPITDNNMSIVFSAGLLDDFIGQQIYAEINGQIVSEHKAINENGSVGLTVIGYDMMMNYYGNYNYQLAVNGDVLNFVILIDNEVLVYIESSSSVTYTSNGEEIISVININGCTDISACNYAFYATTNDGSCLYLDYEQSLFNACCLDNSITTICLLEDVSCESVDCINLGCMETWADNYDPFVTEDDGTCYRYGCTLDWADNLDVLATINDGSCFYTGCSETWADNYDSTATISTSQIPEQFSGNTGANMTVMLTPDFINSLNITNENAYIVASASSGVIVGSSDLYGFSQKSMAIWGDDTQTSELDGASANESISFQLVNGVEVYDVVMPSPVLYVTNGLSVQTSSAILNLDNGCIRLGCTSDWADNYDDLATENDNSCLKEGCTSDWADNYDALATEDDDSCFKLGCTSDWADNFDPFATISSIETFPEPFVGNTGANMSVFLTPNFVSALTILDVDAYIVATVESGLVIGSQPIYGVTQTNLALWGDNATTTDVIDGALSNELVIFQVVDGDSLYDLSLASPVIFMVNGLSALTTAPIVTLISGDDCTRLGCTSDWADNFDSLATEDDESCSRLGCTEDWADNYDAIATDGDGSCSKLGCIDISDCNFDVLATIDDGSCIGQPGCLDHFYLEYNQLAGCSLENACQTSWIQLYDSLQVEYNDLDISYNIGVQELSNTNLTLDSLEVAYSNQTEVYIDSINLITINYNSLDEECTQGMIQSANVIESLNLMNESYLDSISQITQDYNSLEATAVEDMIQSVITIDSLNYFNASLSEDIEYWSSPIVIDLILGWNIIGYTPKEPQDIVATLQEIDDIILIVKNNAAEVYWPEYGFNGIGNLIPGQGYQIKVSDEYLGFTYPNVNGERIELTPTVPQWAIDMEVEMHPNDIRTLVKVVNMLGQEVNPITQFKGAVLLYLYNDATVEKKIK